MHLCADVPLRNYLSLFRQEKEMKKGADLKEHNIHTYMFNELSTGDSENINTKYKTTV